ncbi:hypothetical protein AWN90_02775 [Nocardia terpenica]|uniref:Uncharacterized protein n=1 Tax=Nocardia terpenica TaxID=455432 RepID=A0A161Z0Z3_9NOCA|nr:hypothetical protein [Nocardia terpenica]KZM71834.1 hypothetical protein AWN90_02775 [Nocardia terpenica]NQE90890.1 hypothetical protein [Nocardia terpenica]
MRGGSRSRPTSVVIVLVFVWLIIGAIAGGQRHYYTSAPTNCASTGTIAVTIIAGPLNYLGMHPTVGKCHVDVPQPSP